jgi:hypothetical protein
MAGVGGGLTKRKYEPLMNADKRGWNTKRTLGGKTRVYKTKCPGFAASEFGVFYKTK